MERRWEHVWIALFVVVVGLSLCPWNPGGVPDGVYLDEVANLNDLKNLQLHGRDMWGKPFPLYFRSVDDYKNPVYLYLALPWAAVFGTTPTSLRIFSVAMTLVSSLLFFGLVRHYGWNRRLALLGMLLFFLSPSLLTVKRMIFAVNALVFTLTLAWFLWVRALERGTFWSYALAGLAFGAVTYSYTGARLMSLLLAGFLFVFTARHAGERRRGAMVALAAYGVALVPLLVFVLSHPDFLAARMRMVSLWHNHGAARFLVEAPWNYLKIVFGFLWFDGDANLRHQFGPLGSSYLAFLPLVALGLLCAWRRRRRVRYAFLLWGFVVFPLPAAVTIDPLHNLRTLHALPFLVLLAGEGARFLLARRPTFERVSRTAWRVMIGGKRFRPGHAPLARVGSVVMPDLRAVTPLSVRFSWARPLACTLLGLALAQGLLLAAAYAAAYRTVANPYFCGGTLRAITRARQVAGDRPLVVHDRVFVDETGVVDRTAMHLVHAFGLQRWNLNLSHPEDARRVNEFRYTGQIAYRPGTLVLVLEAGQPLLDDQNFWQRVEPAFRAVYRLDPAEYRVVDRWPAGPRGRHGEPAEFRLLEKIR